MFRRIVLAGAGGLVVAAVFAFGVTATRWQTAEALTNCTTGSEGLDGDETSVIQQINQQRVNQGLPKLLVAPSLNRAAAWKSADSSNSSVNFGHTDSLQRSPLQRAIDCGYPSGAGENIAYGYSAVTLVPGWMSSTEGHRENILNSYYAVIGVGRTGNSWVANFGTVVEAGSYALPDTSAGATPNTPTPWGGGNPNPGGGGATAPAGTATEPPVPGAARTVLPSTPIPQYKLPANVPVKRAMMQMLAFE